MAPNGTWFAVGAERLRKCVDGTWSIVTPPSATNLKCIWGTSPNSLWVGSGREVAGGNSRIFFWNGSSWVTQLDLGSSDFPIVDIYGTSPTNVYAVAIDHYGATPGRIYYFNGTTWTLEDSSGVRPMGIWIDANGRVYVPSFDWGGSGIYLRWKDAGGAWQTDSTCVGANDNPVVFATGPGPAGQVYLGVTNNSPSYGTKIRYGQQNSWTTIYGPVTPGQRLFPTGSAPPLGWHNTAWCDPVTGQIFACAQEAGSPYLAHCLHFDGVSTWTWRHIGTSEVGSPFGVHGLAANKVMFAMAGSKVATWNGTSFVVEDITLGVGGPDTFLDVVGFDTSPPVLQNQVPAPAATGVSVSTTIYLELIDVLTGIRESTVILTVNGVIAWSGGAAQNGYGVVEAVITNGYSYTITPPAILPEGVAATIGVTASDYEPVPNTLTTSYSFTTSAIGPVITNLSPAHLATGVARIPPISFDVVDVGSGVNPDAVIIRVGGMIAYQSGTARNGFSVVRTIISNGYHYVLTVPIAYGYTTPVTIQVDADDLS